MTKIAINLMVSILVVAWNLPAQNDELNRPVYKSSGIAPIIKFGMELHKNLKPEYKTKVYVKPINIETDVAPYARLEVIKSEEDNKEIATILLSAGFVDLVNYVAHAKAIDRIEKGYFQKYIMSLSQETGETELREPQNLNDSRYWTREMLNEQLSNFNQIIGVVVGIKLSHYYLGYYDKYRTKLTDTQGNNVPISEFLTPEEWEESVRCGVRNSMDTGLMLDGIKALFECIDKMPKRPGWTKYFLPEKIKYSKTKRNMDRYEKKFLAGEDF
jgi:hypothetical protein